MHVLMVFLQLSLHPQHTQPLLPLLHPVLLRMPLRTECCCLIYGVLCRRLLARNSRWTLVATRVEATAIAMTSAHRHLESAF